MKPFTVLILVLLALSLLAAAYIVSVYGPAYNDYQTKVKLADADYAAIVNIFMTTKSFDGYMSPGWYQDFKAAIDRFNGSVEDAREAGEPLKGHYDPMLRRNDERFNQSLAAIMDYYDAPSHTVTLYNPARNTVMVYVNGTPINVTVCRDVADPSYRELVEFLVKDHTEYAEYDNTSYVCTNFAVALYQNASAAGIRAHIVSIRFENETNGHMVVAFDTERGRVCVDDTACLDAVAEPRIGEPYVARLIYPPGQELGTINKTIASVDTLV